MRPPIIAVLCHVDHGKTTLLDALRRTSLAAAEPGGITQTIGAFKVSSTINHQPLTITFIDTPGHEAFSKMRSRGANVADIALLVVAADDGVKPQTLESVSIIKSAGIPFIVCINKIDLEGADPVRVKTDLGKHDAAVEGFGGNIPVVELSAKTGKNLPELLEIIQLVWELQASAGGARRAPARAPAPRANLQIEGEDVGAGWSATGPAVLEAPIIDSRLDPHSGPIANVIIRQGVLRLGDQIAAGSISGKVKSLTGDLGQRLDQALPGDPVQVLGLKSVPPVGSVLTHSSQKTRNEKQETMKLPLPSSLLPLPSSLNVILKADSVATLETLTDAIARLPESKFLVINSSIGDITESDILLAASAKANMIGFRIKIPKKRQQLAKNESVLIIADDIIYRLLDRLTALQKPVAEKLPPETGRAKIVKIFAVDGAAIAGCLVESGKLEVGNSVFLVKDDVRLGPARIKQLKSRSDNIKEAKVGTECGVLLAPEAEAQKLKLSEGQDIIAYQAEIQNEQTNKLTN